MLQIFQMLLWGFSTFMFVASLILLVKSIRLLRRVEQMRELQYKQLTSSKEVNDG
ncbi:MAG: hypothetical protein L3J71_01730 [Victivallaceae bacterium]|nr:hypothetical protein [Victivallaceae bacterium]